MNTFLGRHSLMAGLRILIQFLEKKKPLPPFFESKCPFFHLHHLDHFHSHHLSGVTKRGSLGFPWVPLGSLGFPWVPLGSLGFPWEPKGTQGHPREPKGTQGNPREPKGNLKGTQREPKGNPSREPLKGT